MNLILLATYILLSVGGATLIKLGGSQKEVFFTMPFFDFNVSALTFLGILGYGLSFLLFIVLLNKLELSYLTPVATGVSYTLLMGASVLIFNESFSLTKAIGCILILVGIVLIVTNGTKLA